MASAVVECFVSQLSKQSQRGLIPLHLLIFADHSVFLWITRDLEGISQTVPHLTFNGRHRYSGYLTGSHDQHPQAILL